MRTEGFLTKVDEGLLILELFFLALLLSFITLLAPGVISKKMKQGFLHEKQKHNRNKGLKRNGILVLVNERGILRLAMICT